MASNEMESVNRKRFGDSQDSHATPTKVCKLSVDNLDPTKQTVHATKGAIEEQPEKLLERENESLGSLKVKDLNIILHGHFILMQQEIMKTFNDTLHSTVEKITQKKFAAQNDRISTQESKCSELNAEIVQLKSENKKLMSVVTEQQKFLTRIDTQSRKRNVIITGILEDTPLESDSGVAVNDREKADKVFDCIGCADIVITEMERLGKYQQTGTATRPLKVTLADSEQRWRVLRNSKKLKEAGRAFRKVFVKKDLDPATRKELSRLRDVVKSEKAKPENAGKIVLLEGKERRVLVDGLEVDRFKFQPF